MSVVVVDASVAGKWLIEEEHTPAALLLLDERYQLHAPDFFLLEMDNVICKWLRCDLITPTLADGMRDTLRRVRLHLHPFVESLDSAYAIAASTGRSVYDALYIALAISLDIQMATADRRLCNALAGGQFGRHVLWVEDIE